MKKLTVLFVLFLISFPLSAQSKIVIEDKSSLLNSAIDSLLTLKLAENSLEYVSMVDIRKKCEYTFSSIESIGNKNILKILDCNDKIIGEKDLGNSFASQTDNDKVILLNYAIKDIIENPGVFIVTSKPQTTNSQSNNVSVANDNNPINEDFDYRGPVTNNQHSSRYFFTPTAYNLEKGELYYNSLYFLVHDVQYGITDKFSLGMGTTVGGFPIYLTPKFTLYHGEKVAFAVGDLMMIGTWGSSFFGNITYGVVSLGNEYNNFSLGAGNFHLSGGDFPKSNKLVVNAAFMVKMSDYFYFISENYLTGFKDNVYRPKFGPEKWIDDPYSDDPMNGWYDTEYLGEESVERKNTVLFGISGIRFINKKRDIVSYQVGITYIAAWFGDIPARFEEYNYRNNFSLVIPMVSYTKKFSLKY